MTDTVPSLTCLFSIGVIGILPRSLASENKSYLLDIIAVLMQYCLVTDRHRQTDKRTDDGLFIIISHVIRDHTVLPATRQR